MSKFSETWDDPPAQRHSPTSVAAAQSMKGKLGPLHTKIFNYLYDHPEGATDEKMQDALQMAQNTQRPRRVELERAGRIKDSGRYDLTKSRRKATVWVVS